MLATVTAVAAVQPYEQGAFGPKDPVAAFVPSFADLAAYRDGPAPNPRTGPATRPVLPWHLPTTPPG